MVSMTDAPGLALHTSSLTGGHLWGTDSGCCVDVHVACWVLPASPGGVVLLCTPDTESTCQPDLTVSALS